MLHLCQFVQVTAGLVNINPEPRLKDTCYPLGKNSQNQQLLDILACNSANRPPFNKRIHTFLPHCPYMFITWITGQNVQKLLILAVFT